MPFDPLEPITRVEQVLGVRVVLLERFGAVQEQIDEHRVGHQLGDLPAQRVVFGPVAVEPLLDPVGDPVGGDQIFDPLQKFGAGLLAAHRRRLLRARLRQHFVKRRRG